MKNKDAPHYVDKILLEYYIARAELSKEEVAEKLGISISAFRTKINGKRPFLVSEMFDLIELLKIPEEDARQIFKGE